MTPIMKTVVTIGAVTCLISTSFLMLAVKGVVAADDYTFGAENITKGYSVDPANKNAEDANYNQLVEGDQYADTNYSGSSENVVYGTGGDGSFPSALDTDDATRRSYTEENTAAAPPAPYDLCLYPTGDSSVNWDTVYPSTPTTHYDKVDETTSAGDGSTTYVMTASNGDMDIFTMSDIGDPGAGYNINVTVFAIHQKDSNPGADFQAGIRISSTNYLPIVVNPANGVWTNDSGATWALNPATSSEWTYSEVNALLTVITTSDASPSVYCTKVGLIIDISFSGGAANYELDAQITYSGVTSSAQTTGYKVFCQGYRTDASEDFYVQAWDYIATDWNTKDTIDQASDTDFDFVLTADERDAGANEVKLRILGATESSDTTQNVVYLDVLKISRIEKGYALDVDMTSSTAPQYGNITLRVKGYTSAETFQIDVWNYTSSAYDTNVHQITDLGNSWQTTIDLFDDHHRSGTSVKVRFVDVTAAASDTTQDTLYLDVVWVTHYFTDPEISDYGANPTEVDEGNPIVFYLTVTDYDNQAMSYVYLYIDSTDYPMTENNSGDTDTYDSKLYYLSKSDLGAGEYEYYFKVKDAESGEITTTPDSVTVTAPSNNAPYFTSSPTATGHNNTLYYYDANAEDDDEDPLTFDLEGSIEAWASITPSTGVVQGTPTEIGDYWMNISVTDGIDTVWQNTSIHIYTDSPSFVTSPITTWLNGTTYQYNAQATDPEAEGLSFDLEGNGTSFVGITPAGYYCLLSGAITEMGWWYLNLSVSDGVNTVWQNFSLNATNDAPYFTSEPVTECVVNESYIYLVEADDNNSDALTYSIDSSPSETKIWLSYNISSGQLEGVPTTNGSYDVNLSVTDTVGATTWQNFTIVVDLSDADTVSVLKFIIAIVFCFGFMAAGFKEKLLMILAGFCWIICGIAVFMDYGQEFMVMGVGLGMVLMIKGVYDAQH